MKYLTLILALAAAQSLQADTIVEMDQTELRARVASGDGMRLGPILRRVQAEHAAIAVDVRAFGAQASSDMYYRILLKGQDAMMHMVVVDAKTGDVMSAGSDILRDIGTSARFGDVKSAAMITAQKGDDI